MNVRGVVWLTRFAVVTGGAAVPAAALVTVSPETAERRPAAAMATAPTLPYAADSLARIVIRSNLFRLERRPAQTAYSLADDAPGIPRVVRPALVLRGLIGGDTARALIEGFPNENGSRLVRAGDVVSGMRVLSISPGRVRVAGPDTTYVLALRRSDP